MCIRDRYTTTCHKQLRAELNQAATDGYAAADQQRRLGEKSLGTCIVDAQNKPCAGIGFNVDRSQTDAQRESQLVTALMDCRDRINERLQKADFARLLP